jgi:guanylate kinase
VSEIDEFNLYHPEPLLIVISGPSGVGKDSVIQCMKDRGLPFHYVVTATTRPKRPEECHGVDYYFLSHDEFAGMIEQDELLEYAIVYNDYKGIPKQQGIKLRIATALQEYKRIDLFDYVVVNHEGDLANTVDTILSIIDSEHHRVHPRKVTL